ncbi:hypothetical protein FFLO_06051 [Filobasidium floriforme]|uniref:Apple domain-containing protein n=1 Tax=Filobasidium floriforme TaxID=5210 RepID=A0A8K0NN86_9TREE|nr:uncharacterized protein HD553DRAFT_344228 [Filobasidium floriforme]KAG7528597.1 hypothetical protein FFLO_06051 [Filobasidium floriforme]KAH8081513.1 hypothetical protein HD553DRAFT_344228 [Filobasidium floriforme]
MSKKIQAALVVLSAFASLSRADGFPRCIEGAQEGGKHIAAAFYSRDARWQSGSWMSNLLATSITECIDMCQYQNDHRDQYGGKPCKSFGYQAGLNNCDFYSDNFATVHKQDTPASYGKVWVGGMIEGLDCAGYAAGGFVLPDPIQCCDYWK